MQIRFFKSSNSLIQKMVDHFEVMYTAILRNHKKCKLYVYSRYSTHKLYRPYTLNSLCRITKDTFCSDHHSLSPCYLSSTPLHLLETPPLYVLFKVKIMLHVGLDTYWIIDMTPHGVGNRHTPSGCIPKP
jgi:hypothetical protein